MVSTQSTNTKRVDHHYVYENDTLRITYDLWEDNGQMSFSVYNKLKVPLFVDWKNSSFISNDVSYKYWQDVENSTSVSSGTSYYGLQTLTGVPVSVHKGTQNTTVQRPERITSIPPQSEIKQVKFSILAKEHYHAPTDTTTIFNSINSPIKFRNYLVLSTSENLSNLFYTDNQFYVCKYTVIPSNRFVYTYTNSNLRTYPYLSPDLFYFYIYPQN